MSRRMLFAIGATICIVIAAWYFAGSGGHLSEVAATHAEEPPGRPVDQVVLTPEKQAAAKLKIEPITVRTLQPERMTPGRIRYDETRHVELRVPTEGVVRELKVRPGDVVTAGQAVAVIESPEIGDRRADVLLREGEVRLAKRELENATAVQSNLLSLLEKIKPPVDIEAVQAEFVGKNLGDFREPIFTGYSKLIVAERILAQLKPLATAGLATGRSYVEQQGARDVAIAAYQAACETAKFSASQRQFKAETLSADADRRLAIARERLASLIGSGADAPMPAENSAALSLWSLRAPIGGTVEELLVAASERLTLASGVMIVADTSTLWVEAEVRDRDWSALHLQQGDTVRLEVTAFPGRSMAGTVVFIGRAQLKETRAVPVVVKVENPRSELRPGMFARVSLPMGDAVETLAMPKSAVMHHERRQFVFVEDSAGKFHAVDVELGQESHDAVELLSGPKAGDKVVTAGAFYLKSELLLEPEE